MIVHVFVVGFHHKKGCLVEFCYPPINTQFTTPSPSDEIKLPEQWKHLPSLALPDGAHKVEEDCVYFHLPSLESQNKCMFGVSCYRQIAVEKLINRKADVTRTTVQKSVCVLSELPLYGRIESTLKVITHAYFNKRDFDQVDDLQGMFFSLSPHITIESVETEALVGLSLRELVIQYRHKLLLLFKLILLERRILIHLFPVRKLCHTVLLLLSLFPRMVEHGLYESAAYVPCSQPSAEHNDRSRCDVDIVDRDASVCQSVNVVCSVPDENSTVDNEVQHVKLRKTPSNSSSAQNNKRIAISDPYPNAVQDCLPEVMMEILDTITQDEFWNNNSSNARGSGSLPAESPLPSNNNTTMSSSAAHSNFKSVSADNSSAGPKISHLQQQLAKEKSSNNRKEKRRRPSDFLSNLLGVSVAKGGGSGDSSRSSTRDVSPSPSIGLNNSTGAVEIATDAVEENMLSILSELDIDDYGFPLSIFTKGVLCHPYLSLSYIDFIQNPGIRGYLVGATNVLYTQRKDLFDVIVTIPENNDLVKVDFLGESNLKNLVRLTTADDRFMSFIVDTVSKQQQMDGAFPETSWEGGDEWIRAQFKEYLLSLLTTAKANDSARDVDFDSAFMKAFRSTHNYRVWACHRYEILERSDAPSPRHMFHGKDSITDIFRKFGNRIDIPQESLKVVSDTTKIGKKVIGTAANQARTALFTATNWWTGGATEGGLPSEPAN